MPKTITRAAERVAELIVPAQRKIAVKAIADKSYEQGWKDREALYAAEQSGIPARPAA